MGTPEVDNTKPWSVARLLEWTREYLDRQSIESARLCAEILLAHVLECERIELYTRHDAVPGEPALTSFRELVRSAATGTPIAYLTGHKEFFSLRFEVSPAVLIPRPETEVLVERVISLVRGSGTSSASILDLGTGSGCIAISLAKNLPQAKLLGTDISAEALELAQRNAAHHGVADRINFGKGDLFAACPDGASFDVIVTNPPYIGEREADELPSHVRDHEPRVALFAGEDGLELYRRLATDAGQWLAPHGHLLAEVAYNQASLVGGLLKHAGWDTIVTYRDDLQHERVVHARRHAAERSCVA